MTRAIWLAVIASGSSCLATAGTDATATWSVALAAGSSELAQSASVSGASSPASGTGAFAGVDDGSTCDWVWGALAGGAGAPTYYQIDTLGGSVVTTTSPGSVGTGSLATTPTEESTVYRLRTGVGPWVSTDTDSLEGACDASGLQSISEGAALAACAIRATDQSLWCWGYNSNQMVASPSAVPIAIGSPQEMATTGTLTWRQVSAGYGVACAIKTDGTLWCWGNNSDGGLGNGGTTSTSTPTQVGTAATWSQVAAGTDDACATQTNGSLYCWGLNNYGELATGDETNRLSPTQVSGTWDSVSAYVNTMCGIQANGTLWCWGYGSNGQLGNGTTTSAQLTPSQVGSAATWAHVSVGAYTTCATQTNGTLWCWGYNSHGELGNGTTVNSDVPVQVGSSRAWATISSGTEFECGTQTDGTVWCWGYNAQGQIGNATTANQSTPVDVTNGGAGDEVTAGNATACVVATSETATCWGDDNFGELGIGTTLSYDTPNRAGTATTWASAAEGTEDGCALQTNQTLWCWGGNAYSQIGNGTSTNEESPVQIGSSTWSEVSTGSFSSCGLQTTGTLWCWGYGGTGGLGNGGTANSAVPTQVGTASTWEQVSVGAQQACAVQSNHTLWCWGTDNHGQLGDGATTNQDSPEQIDSSLSWASVSAGDDVTCSITTGGALYCWGLNTTGNTGNGNTTSPQTTPQQVDPGVTDWAQLSQPGGDTCATRTDGSLWCWGYNSNGEIGDGTTTERNSPVQIDSSVSTWSSVATDIRTVCATRTDGTLWCWGLNTDGTVGDGTTTQRNSPVQIGSSTSWTGVTGSEDYTMCGVQSNGTLWCWGDASSGAAADGVTRDATSPGTSILGGAIWSL